jgi:hypothetical protein
MGAQVFANGMEVSCKKSDDMSVAAMPDVCWTPPPPPVGPVPIPYPNFSKSSDTTDGTKTVKIAGEEVGMKNQSNYKTSNGDEAATKGVGMGIVTATIQGTTQFAAWSFDVMFEGANAIRFMDMTTHNHASDPANPPSVTVSTGSPGVGVTEPDDCQELQDQLKAAESADTKTGKVDPGQVMATAKHTGKGSMKAASQSMMKTNIKPEALSGYLSRPERPTRPDGKTTEPKVACTDSAYNNWTCNSGHAEGKIIQSLFGGTPPGGSVTVRIKWNDAKQNKLRHDPCPACKSAICKTMDACGITFYLCEGAEGKPLKKTKAPCNGEGSWESPPASPPAEFA